MNEISGIKLLGVGSPIVDTLASVSDDFITDLGVAKGGMMLVDEVSLSSLMGKLTDVAESSGGSVGNTCIGAAKLGLKTAFIGKLGTDKSGQFYQDNFAQQGVDVSRLKFGKGATGRCLSLMTTDGQRTMQTSLGAAAMLHPDEISVVDFKFCQHVHTEGYLLFNRELLKKVLDCAKSAGCTISLDLSSFEVVNAAQDILADVLREYIDIVFANEDEGSAFTSLGKDYYAIAKKLAEFCEISALKIGAKGALIVRGKKLIEIAPIPVSRVVDTTGAGDLWAAGFLYSWLNDKSLAQCGYFGGVLGATVIQEVGACMSKQQWSAIKEKLSTDRVICQFKP